MSISSKSPALRLLLALVLSPVALVTGGHEPSRQGSTEAPTQQTRAAAVSAFNAEMGSELVSRPEAMPMRIAFCLPGEKLVCTLGPPPVCSCQ